jgi:hypothetical protein
VWVECGHWLNLAGEWVSVETLLYSITRQSLVTWGNLHEWVKQKTADLLGLRGEVTSEPPFSTLDFLARKIENRLNQQSLGAGNPETRLWLNQLGIELSRIELDDQAETLRIRTLGNVLANTTWQTISRLEVVPYISGTPAGMPNHVDAVWLDEVLYAENRPLSKLANSVSQVIGNVFGNLSINDAVKLCFDRSPEFVSEYMEENFKLAPGPPMIIEPEENAILTVEGKIEDGPVERIVEPDAMPKFNANEHIDEDESDDDWETDVDFKDDELEDEDEPSRSRKRVKPPIMERYALVQGFKKEGEKRFYHSDGSWIAKTDDRSFPWEKRSASGELIHYYWPKDHCLEHSPLEMDTDVWHLIESYPDLYSLVLSDFRGEPVAVAGSKLKEMRKDGRLKFFSATYRLVYNSE